MGLVFKPVYWDCGEFHCPWQSWEEVLCLKGMPFNIANIKVLHHIPAPWLSSIPCIPSPSIHSTHPPQYLWDISGGKFPENCLWWREAEKNPARAYERHEKPLSARSCWACNPVLYCQVVTQSRRPGLPSPAGTCWAHQGAPAASLGMVCCHSPWSPSCFDKCHHRLGTVFWGRSSEDADDVMYVIPFGKETFRHNPFHLGNWRVLR